MTSRTRNLGGIVLGAAVATVVACTPQGGSTTGAASRSVEQDINASRDLGPTSANPGAPLGGSPYLPARSGTEEEVEAVPPAPATSAVVQPDIGVGGIAEGGAEAGDAQIGRRFALNNCQPCHIVAPTQSAEIRFANAPEFHAIADAANTTPLALAVWLTNPHPTMPTLVLSPQEARNVIAYILSLREGH